MDFPSGCFLWRGILQQFRYLGASGVSFFCRFCAGSCRVFSPSSRFSSEIFHILRMLPAVFLLAIPVFFGSRSIFFCRSCVGVCRISFPSSRFFPESFAFCGCRLPCFFQPYRHFFPFFCLSRLWKTSCFPVFVRTFCMEPTRAHSHARNNILSSLSGFLFLLPQNMP